MKLKLYNKETAPQRTNTSGYPMIRFHAKGNISISSKWARMLNIEEKHFYAMLAQDKERLIDWYLILTHQPSDGFKFKIGGTSKQFTVGHTDLCKRIMDQFAPGAKSVAFRLATQPVDLDMPNTYALFTKSPEVRK